MSSAHDHVTEEKRISVVFAADGRYLRFAGIALASVIATLDPEWGLDAFIIGAPPDDEERERFDKLQQPPRVRLFFLPVTAEMVSAIHVPAGAHWSMAANYRFLLGRLLPPTIRRTIYLDCDVLVRASLHDLFEADLHGATIGVVEDAGSEQHASLGLKHNPSYFNSGVLLIDVEAWRNRGAEEACFACAAENYGRFVNVDQDILNLVFDGSASFLSPRWNVQVPMYNRCLRYAEAVLRPQVVHYTTASKPWLPGDAHPMGQAYREFAGTTPWPIAGPANALVDLLKWTKRFCVRYLLFHCWRLTRLGG